MLSFVLDQLMKWLCAWLMFNAWNKSNSSILLTLDGVDVMGERFAVDVCNGLQIRLFGVRVAHELIWAVLGANRDLNYLSRFSIFWTCY